MIEELFDDYEANKILNYRTSSNGLWDDFDKKEKVISVDKEIDNLNKAIYYVDMMSRSRCYIL